VLALEQFHVLLRFSTRVGRTVRQLSPVTGAGNSGWRSITGASFRHAGRGCSQPAMSQQRPYGGREPPPQGL